MHNAQNWQNEVVVYYCMSGSKQIWLCWNTGSRFVHEQTLCLHSPVTFETIFTKPLILYIYFKCQATCKSVLRLIPYVEIQTTRPWPVFTWLGYQSGGAFCLFQKSGVICHGDYDLFGLSLRSSTTSLVSLVPFPAKNLKGNNSYDLRSQTSLDYFPWLSCSVCVREHIIDSHIIDSCFVSSDLPSVDLLISINFYHIKICKSIFNFKIGMS